jgi:hypothetical protein
MWPLLSFFVLSVAVVRRVTPDCPTFVISIAGLLSDVE